MCPCQEEQDGLVDGEVGAHVPEYMQQEGVGIPETVRLAGPQRAEGVRHQKHGNAQAEEQLKSLCQRHAQRSAVVDGPEGQAQMH